MHGNSIAKVLAIVLCLLPGVKGQQPLLQLQGQPFFGGNMKLHVTAPSDVGDIVWLGVGLDPLPLDAPVPTSKGLWYIGTFLTPMLLGTIPSNGRLDVPFTVPPATAGIEGTVIALQAYVAPALSNPATLSLDESYLLAAEADVVQSPQPSKGALFGTVVAVGDLNADGAADLAVGASFEDVGGVTFAGRVYVLWGPALVSYIALDPVSPVPYGVFGAGMTVTDVTGDSIDDLVVAQYAGGDPPAPTAHAHVYVYEGGGSFGSTPTPKITIQSPGTGVPYGVFGRTLVTGDFNGDSHVDLAVGNSNELVDGFDTAGEIDIYWGPHFGSILVIKNPQPGGSDFFGSALATADLNGDGIDDLIEGSGRDDAGSVVNVGSVHLYLGPDLGLVKTIDNPLPQGFNSRFGEEVHGADLNGDGTWEVIAVDLKNRVYIFWAPDFSTFTAAKKPEAINTVSINSSSFGYFVESGDVNGDGIIDILVSDIFEGVMGCGFGNEGTLFAALGPYYSTFDVIPNPLAACGDSFSRPIVLGDVDGDGSNDLVTASQTADVAEIENAGRVFIFPGGQ
jgi:hypothetical protein